MLRKEISQLLIKLGPSKPSAKRENFLNLQNVCWDFIVNHDSTYICTHTQLRMPVVFSNINLTKEMSVYMCVSREAR
jgi:hypothetical protein